MKSPKKTVKRQRVVKAVTLNQIEAAGPCHGRYREFLTAIHANPVPDGRYGHAMENRVKTTKFGPDTPIPLDFVLNKCRAPKDTRDYYTRWLITNLPVLAPLRRKYDAAFQMAEKANDKKIAPLRRQLQKLESRILKMENTGQRDGTLAQVVK